MDNKMVFRPMTSEDKKEVMDIFNYYIENSFAAYPESKLGYDFYDVLLNVSKGYPNAVITDQQGEVVGFGLLRPYNPMPVFRHTAEISYFIKPEYTCKGVGRDLLGYLLDEAKKINISNIMSSISSLNEASIKFHLKNGFVECGRFVKVGRKNNTDFDVVWMQRQLI